MADYDVIVVGGGAQRPGRRGLSGQGREVGAGLELLGYVGGAAVSEAVFPGLDVRLSKYAYLVSLLPD